MGILKEFVKANQFLNESKLSQFGTPEDLILTGKVTVAKDQYGNNEQDVSDKKLAQKIKACKNYKQIEDVLKKHFPSATKVETDFEGYKYDRDQNNVNLNGSEPLRFLVWTSHSKYHPTRVKVWIAPEYFDNVFRHAFAAYTAELDKSSNLQDVDPEDVKLVLDGTFEQKEKGNAEIKELLNLAKMDEFVKSLKRRTSIDGLIRAIKSYKIKKSDSKIGLPAPRILGVELLGSYNQVKETKSVVLKITFGDYYTRDQFDDRGRPHYVGKKSLYLSFGVTSVELVPHEAKPTKSSALKNTPEARMNVIKWIIGTAKGMLGSLFSRDKGGVGGSHSEF